MEPIHDSQPPATEMARVASILLCECSVLSSPHLSVDLIEVPVHNDQARAISYAWGEFSRAKVPIGHFEDGTVVEIELGKEWIVPDVISSLASLSSQLPIWLDQLCIPQKDEAVREALAKIPTIYRTFDVAVLMPGRPCKCLKAFLLEAEACLPAHRGPECSHDSAYYKNWEEPKILLFKQHQDLFLKYHECLNFHSPSSWLNRLWPWQELMYAQRVRCVWASQTTPQCVQARQPQDGDMEHLGPYLAAMRVSLLGQGLTETETRSRLQDYTQEFAVSGMGEVLLSRNANFTGTANTELSLMPFYNFLNGTPLENLIGQSVARNGRNMWSFMNVLAHAIKRGDGRSRSTTQPHDYVVAIWVDCPDYQIPRSFKTMPLGSLLQDAMDQLTARHRQPSDIGYVLPTTAPRGLFGTTASPSFLWDAEEYFASVNFNTLKDVYSPLLWDSDVFMTTKIGVPLARMPAADKSPSVSVLDMNAFIQSSRKSKPSVAIGDAIMFRLLRRITSKWQDHGRVMLNIEKFLSPQEYYLALKMIGQYDDSPLSPIPTLSSLMDEGISQSGALRYILVRTGKVFAEYHSPDPSKLFEAMPVDPAAVEKALYTMIATGLGLDPGFCRQKGVKIMWDYGNGNIERARLGFIVGDAPETEIASVSVRMSAQGPLGVDRQGSLIYEAACLVPNVPPDNEIPDLFRVVGVWLPVKDVREEQYQARTIPLSEDPRGMKDIAFLV